MALSNRDKLLTAALARGVVETYGQFLEEIANEVKKEVEGPINATTAESIALEYKRREGIKEGVTLFLKRLSAKTHE